MTFESYIYLIPALISFFWPLAALFCKREVSDSQWALMGAQIMLGVTMALYASFFVPCLEHEHLLCHLYVMMALLTPVFFLAGITRLTTMGGFTKQIRRFFLLPVFAMTLITAIALIGGFNNYQHFLATAVHGGDLSLVGDFWYDVMVICEFYGFLTMLAIEVIIVIVIVAPCVRQYVRLMEDNFVSPPRSIRLLRPYLAALFVMVLLLLLLEVNFPLHFLKSRFLLVCVCVMQSVITFSFGYFVYNIRYSAERLQEMQCDAEVVTNQFRKLGLDEQVTVERVSEQVRTYLEDCKGCLDPTVSVFKIARQFHVDQDMVVRAIHLIKGVSFAEYVNSLRVEYALGVVMERLEGGMRNDDPYDQSRFTDSLAASCGYPSTASFYIGFAQVMGQPFNTWMTAMVETKNNE